MMKKLQIITLLLFLTIICSAQISIDSIKVYRSAAGFDSIYLKYTSYIPKIDTFTISNIVNDGITRAALHFIGCSTAVAVQKDTTIFYTAGISGAGLWFFTVWDISSICNFPTTPTITDRTIRFPTSIDENEILKKYLRVYPNPTQSYFSLKLPERVLIRRIDVLDLQGSLVKSFRSQQAAFDLAEVSNGVYFKNNYFRRQSS